MTRNRWVLASSAFILTEEHGNGKSAQSNQGLS